VEAHRIHIPAKIIRAESEHQQDERSHLFLISDNSIDSYGTVFLHNCWDLSYRKEGKRQVTYGHPEFHDLNPDVIIGIGREYTDEEKGLYSELTLEPEGTNQIADKVHNKLRFGSLTDASIVAEIEDGHPGRSALGEDPNVFYFTRAKLINWGVVPFGSNRNAKIQESRSAIADFIQKREQHLIEKVEKQERTSESLLEDIERNKQIIRLLRMKHFYLS
jgi:hypothetical protein